MEKGIWLFPRPEDTHCASSLNLQLGGPKNSCQSDDVKASQAELQQGQHCDTSAQWLSLHMTVRQKHQKCVCVS